MKTGLTSCMEATILGREWCYAWSLVRLNGSVAGTVWIGIAGCHFCNPVLVTDVNARHCHPLMEDYKFTSFCCVVRVCMCLNTSTILDRIGGTSLVTPRIWFLCI
jgi:hypothetical protein